VYGQLQTSIEQINNTTGTVTYLHHDQQGSTRLITGSTGKVEGKCSYSAYGTPTCEGTATTPLGWDGQYTSSDTGLIYLRNRVYDPATAQFLTVDPAVALTREPYAYGGDNPVNRRDPDGLSAEGLEGVPCYFPFCGPGAPTGTGAEEVIRGGLEKVEHGIESVWNGVCPVLCVFGVSDGPCWAGLVKGDRADEQCNDYRTCIHVGGLFGEVVGYQGQACAVVSSSGEVGVTAGGGPTVSGGTGAVDVGPSVQVSNANNIPQLYGPFAQAGGSAAFGVGGFGDAFTGRDSCDEQISGGNLGITAGIGRRSTLDLRRP
jgi:RHS repeat-associated protein